MNVRTISRTILALCCTTPLWACVAELDVVSAADVDADVDGMSIETEGREPEAQDATDETAGIDGQDTDGDDTTVQALVAASCDSNARTGDYCAGDKVSHGTPGTLYRCNGPGAARALRTCDGGCVVAPAGQDDYCSTVLPTCDSNARTGDYCGGDKVSHGNRNTLYHCNGPGRATVVRACADGCAVAPSGQDDFCRRPAASCDADAHTGEYCGGDKISNGNRNTLYHCNGPGRATVVDACTDGCTIAPAGHDDFCAAGGGSCPHQSLLRWGLAPAASDEMRCAGVASGSISQTIGSAAASAGYHRQDGTIGGNAYCAATDLSTRGLSNAQVRALLSRLADGGFASFFRDPGHDGWPSSEARHIHTIYVGVRMKSELRGQVQDWLNGRNGLSSHGRYTFWQPSGAQKDRVRRLFNQAN